MSEITDDDRLISKWVQAMYAALMTGLPAWKAEVDAVYAEIRERGLLMRALNVKMQ